MLNLWSCKCEPITPDPSDLKLKLDSGNFIIKLKNLIQNFKSNNVLFLVFIWFENQKINKGRETISQWKEREWRGNLVKLKAGDSFLRRIANNRLRGGGTDCSPISAWNRQKTESEGKGCKCESSKNKTRYLKDDLASPLPPQRLVTLLGGPPDTRVKKKYSVGILRKRTRRRAPAYPLHQYSHPANLFSNS